MLPKEHPLLHVLRPQAFIEQLLCASDGGGEVNENMPTALHEAGAPEASSC